MASGFVNGLFGSGGGTISVLALERWLGVERHKSHATAVAIILPLSVISVFVYARAAQIDLWTVLVLSAGGMIGGYLGARYLKKIPSRALRRIFALFMAAAAVRMII